MEEKEKNVLKKGKASFVLIGKAKVFEKTYSEQTSTSGWASKRFNLGVETNNGTIYADLFGGYSTKPEVENRIYCRGVKVDDKGNKSDDFTKSVIVNWNDRFDEKIILEVAESNKIKVGLEVDANGKTFVKDFLSPYDAIDYVKEHLTNGQVVNVKGDLAYSEFNGSVTVKKNIKSIFISKAEPEKYRASFQQTILLDSDSVGSFDKERNTYPIDAYVVDYVGKVNGQAIKKNVTFPIHYELDLQDNAASQKFIKQFFKCKQGKLISIAVEGDFKEGASVAKATIEDLSDDIKSMLAAGMLTEEEAIGLVTTGSNEKVLLIKKPLLLKTTKEDGTIVATVITDTDSYTEEDLVPYASVVNVSNEVEVKSVNDSTSTKVEAKNTEKIEDTESDWLKDLGL